MPRLVLCQVQQDLFSAKVRLVGWCLALCGLRFFLFLSLRDSWSRFFRPLLSFNDSWSRFFCPLLLTPLRCVSFQCLGRFLLSLLVGGSQADFPYEIHWFLLWSSHFKLYQFFYHQTLFHRFFCPASLLDRFLLAFPRRLRFSARLPFLRL